MPGTASGSTTRRKHPPARGAEVGGRGQQRRDRSARAPRTAAGSSAAGRCRRCRSRSPWACTGCRASRGQAAGVCSTCCERAAVGEQVDERVGADDEARPERDHHRRAAAASGRGPFAADGVGDREADEQAAEGGAQRQRDRAQRRVEVQALVEVAVVVERPAELDLEREQIRSARTSRAGGAPAARGRTGASNQTLVGQAAHGDCGAAAARVGSSGRRPPRGDVFGHAPSGAGCGIPNTGWLIPHVPPPFNPRSRFTAVLAMW